METEANSFDPQILRHGLAQILRNYAAAGLKHFSRSPRAQSDVSGDRAIRDVLAAMVPGLPADRRIGSNNSLDMEQRLPAVDDTQVAKRATTLSQLSSAQVQPQSASNSARGASVAATSVSALPVNSLQSPTLPRGTWQQPGLSQEERRLKLSELDAQVKGCRKCDELVCYRRQTVFGEGNLQPRVVFFGEAPGADEDAQGRPFVGPADKLLNDIIGAMRLSREDVYILNSLKCRPPQNRTPLLEEVDNCRQYALAQLEILQPEFIILLGAVAVRSVLQTSDSVGRLRGRFHQFHGARVLVTYHPAYLLRSPEAKKLVWADVQMVMRELAGGQ